MPVGSGTTSGAQAVRRAVNLLRVLSMARDSGYGLTDLARLTGLPHPTVHRMLRALMEEGLVEQKGATHRYVVGQEIQFLALARAPQTPLMTAAESHLGRLADLLGDTLFLTQRTGAETICVARRLGAYPVQVVPLRVGDRRPLGVSSAGLALLAALPADEARRILVLNAPQLAEYRLTVEASAAMVRDARRLGYALRDRGIVPGTRAISVVLRDAAGLPSAALTVAGVVRRLSHRRTSDIAETLWEAAARIERSLG
ncbi:IclR family transcriptional regulator [Phreatobacter sp.]|uniref:IclR family transcriptional regulator n=1 Tax=Phreatobacter sp. TaxID=1966341 RepID=UPI0025DD30F8|nr:IclR family transcriptional regulator [Phreatobacter sp.]